MRHLRGNGSYRFTWCGLMDATKEEASVLPPALQVMPPGDVALYLAQFGRGFAPDLCDACAEALLRNARATIEALKRLHEVRGTPLSRRGGR